VVDFWKNKGTISTMPPNNNTTKIKTIMRKLLVSTFSWDMPPEFEGLDILFFS
jgi:hypothetical protein